MTASENAPIMAPVPKSPWHSPVPYLFGGLAAMLGLIAFSLLILACSYWKLSASLENREDSNEERDLEDGDGVADLKPAPVFAEKFLVIMAGEEKPTYLATPMSSRTWSFGSTCGSNGRSSTLENSNGAEEEREINGADEVQTSTSN